MESDRSVLIRVEHLVKHFPVRFGAYGERKATVHAVDDVSFDVLEGETLGLVGESGCGKSTVGYSILQLYRPTSGRCLYRGKDLVGLRDDQMRAIRQKAQIIFQDPYSTLNPRMTIGDAIAEPIRVHKLETGPRVMARVTELLNDVGLGAKCLNRYPHEFSGGQRQRICLARSLACSPEFVVCDEPISALDVSIQAQIINLLEDLQGKYNLAYLFIAHDLSVVRHISRRVAVMYLGKLAEMAPKEQLFEDPQHPYTKALLSAVPVPNPRLEKARRRQVLGGDVPSSTNPPSGCRFHPRCPVAFEPCRVDVPAWREIGTGHWVACHAVT